MSAIASLTKLSDLSWTPKKEKYKEIVVYSFFQLSPTIANFLPSAANVRLIDPLKRNFTLIYFTFNSRHF